jgi:hypothetical protein
MCLGIDSRIWFGFARVVTRSSEVEAVILLDNALFHNCMYGLSLFFLEHDLQRPVKFFVATIPAFHNDKCNHFVPSSKLTPNF